MIGMGTPVARDLPPHVKAYGSPLRIQGVNTIGLERRGVAAEAIESLSSAYRGGDLLLEKIDAATLGDELSAEIAEWQQRESRRPAATGWVVS